MDRVIYKIATKQEWDEARRSGLFEGAPVDRRDGFIHLSTAAQLRETATKHFAGKGDLVLIEVDAARLAEALRYEPSRGGQLFPHLYAPLPLSAVRQSWTLAEDHSGHHVFPEEIDA
jgi:uncharacterized protein (DUF952 family)